MAGRVVDVELEAAFDVELADDGHEVAGVVWLAERVEELLAVFLRRHAVQPLALAHVAAPVLDRDAVQVRLEERPPDHQHVAVVEVAAVRALVVVVYHCFVHPDAVDLALEIEKKVRVVFYQDQLDLADPHETALVFSDCHEQRVGRLLAYGVSPIVVVARLQKFLREDLGFDLLRASFPWCIDHSREATLWSLIKSVLSRLNTPRKASRA